jgi:hypothetical protein
MEQFFKPTRFFQDLWEEDQEDEDEDEDDNAPFAEVKLSVPVETFLNYSWDFADLFAFASSGAKPKIMWIGDVGDGVVLTVDADSSLVELMNSRSRPVLADLTKNDQKHTLTLFEIGDNSYVKTGALAVFWHAVATSNCVKLRMQEWLVSGSILAQFLEGSPSLEILHLDGIEFNEDHCRALALLQRTDLEVKLDTCTLKSQHHANGSCVEWLRHSQIVTELKYCFMERGLLSALSGNNSIKRLSISKKMILSESHEEKMHSLLQALPGNMGLENLIVLDSAMSDETWILLFRSLWAHPRINSLSTTSITRHLTQESKTAIMNAILQMLRHNTVVHKINLPFQHVFNDQALYQNAILPRLEMNRSYFEEQRRALKRADPSIRPQLLGRALHVVRYNPDLVFRFLAENVPTFVRIEEEKEISAIPLQNDPTIVSGQKRKAP